jgi:hypothetical protein
MPFTQYQGLDVLETLRDRSDAAPDRHARAVDVTGSEFGAHTPRHRQIAPHVDREFVWKALSQAEVSVIREFIDSRKGRLVPFWLPSLDRNFQFSTFPGAGTAWTIKAIGYTANMFPGTGARRHVFARHPVSGWRYRKVTASVDNGDGTETLTVDAGVANISSDFWLVGFLKLYRLAVDEVPLSWASRTFVTARLPLVELPFEAPL